MIKFEVFVKNKKTADVVVNNDLTVNVVNYTDVLWEKPFGNNKNVTYEDVNYFFESRCFPRERYNADELLSLMGLDEYNPFAIVEITHGIQTDDFMWIRFDGDNTTWKDVKVLKYPK